jgi:hypothetical protein
MGNLLLFSAVLSALLMIVTCAAIDERVIGKRDHYSFLQNQPLDEDKMPSFLRQLPPPARMDLQEYGPQYTEQDELVAQKHSKAAGGVAYVRWGHTVCPTGAELVYSGRAAGSYYSHKGGGSNYQCVTLQPENFEYGPGTVTSSFLYGAEYEISGNVPKSFLPLNQHDVPCSVCFVPSKTAKIMIPGTYKCPSSWRLEYYGFLMAERYNHQRSTFECVDKDAQMAQGGHGNHNGALFYFVEPRCGALPCPPYDQQKEMTCAVCTR